MDKKVPLRMCIVTGEMLSKKALLRIVKTAEGTFHVDPTGKMNGRGAYIKKEASLLSLIQKNKALERAFKCEIPESLYASLAEALHE
jgi:predicted RNA-binding protein YlxR (DUF448 family)